MKENLPFFFFFFKLDSLNVKNGIFVSVALASVLCIFRKHSRTLSVPLCRLNCPSSLQRVKFPPLKT